MPTPTSSFPLAKLGCALGTVLLLLWARFLGWDLSSAASFVASAAYPLIAAAALYFIVSLAFVSFEGSPEGGWRRHLPGLAVALVCTGYILLSQPWFLKVEYDESTHLLGSLAMASEARAVLPMECHDLGIDIPYYHGFTVAHRLPLLSWLTSLPVALGVPPLGAVFGLNLFLGFLGVWLAWRCGLELGGRRGGLIAALALGFHPLWAENVSSGGYDVLNACLLLGFFLAGLAWWRKPDGRRLNLLASVAALLALARYESILYTLPAAFLVVAAWRRERRVELTWPAALAPLLLAPALASNLASMVSVSGGLSAAGKAFGAFGLRHWPANASGLAGHLFGFGHDSSTPLFLVGLGGLAFLLMARNPQETSASKFLLGVFLFSSCAVYGTQVMCFYWSSAADPLAVRFTLPLWLGLALCASALGHARRSLWLAPVLVVAGTWGGLANAADAPRRFSVGHSWRGADSWKIPPGVLVVAPGNNRLILRRQPSVMFSRLRRPESLLNLVDASVYREVWVLNHRRNPLPTEGLQLTPLDGAALEIPADSFTVHRIEGMRLPDGTMRLCRPGSVVRPASIPREEWSLGWITRR